MDIIMVTIMGITTDTMPTTPTGIIITITVGIIMDIILGGITIIGTILGTTGTGMERLDWVELLQRRL